MIYLTVEDDAFENFQTYKVFKTIDSAITHLQERYVEVEEELEGNIMNLEKERKRILESSESEIACFDLGEDVGLTFTIHLLKVHK